MKQQNDMNKFKELNERDLYDKILNEAICNYPNCNNKAINSHTYPKSMLKKFSNGTNIVYTTDIKKFIGAAYSKTKNSILNKQYIKNAGVMPLFCQKHDTDVFKRIELNFNNIDIETYLYLFLYRAFIYDYLIEGIVRNSSYRRKIFKDKDYAKKIDKHTAKEYISEQKFAENFIKNMYNNKQHKTVKNKFDKIFLLNSKPTKTDFRKEFDLRYYTINCRLHFLASGIMAYKFDENVDFTNILVSTYALIPSSDLTKTYFTILVPKEERNRMDNVIKAFNIEYEKYNNNEKNYFIKMVEFHLLDSSENIIVDDILYNNLKHNDDLQKLDEIYFNLSKARCSLNIEDEIKMRQNTFILLGDIKLI